MPQGYHWQAVLGQRRMQKTVYANACPDLAGTLVMYTTVKLLPMVRPVGVMDFATKKEPVFAMLAGLMQLARLAFVLRNRAQSMQWSRFMRRGYRICDDEFFGSACELGGTKAIAPNKVDEKVGNETAAEKVEPSDALDEIAELKKMVVKAKDDPMEQASIEKVLHEKQDAVKESGPNPLNETEMDAALLKVSAEEARIAKLKEERERAEKARNPTDVAKIEKRLQAEERGLAASKIDEEVAMENRETEETMKSVSEVKNATKECYEES